MAIEIFRASNGNLLVEKRDATQDEKNLKSTKTGETKTLNRENMVETSFNYSGVLDTSGTGICDICGVQTEYANRHVCTYCWSKYKMEILRALKDSKTGEILIGL